MGKKSKSDPSFAAVVAEVRAQHPAGGGQPVEYATPIRDGIWTDPQGTVWRRRGGSGLPVTVIDRLMRRADVRVVELYLNEATELSGAERDMWWQRIRPNYLHKVDLPPNDHTDFDGAEFANGSGGHLLIFQRSC